MECPVVFYAEPSGTWRGNYKAWNANTGEYMSIVGKGRFDGIYMGAPKPSMIMLTSEDDALFVDDIFSAFPEGNARQSRISSVAEIRAGDGDDIIDMTNEHFTDSNAQITLRGGAGNDIIWAANDGVRLFGDVGDDILVGGFGNDIICGGTDDDTLRGLGGIDIYAFGFDSGNDTIILDDGDFLLWFDEGISLSDDDITIDGDSAVISFGMLSTITVNNLPDGSLTDRFLCGDCGEHAGMTYAALADLGAFDSDTTARIFNTIA